MKARLVNAISLMLKAKASPQPNLKSVFITILKSKKGIIALSVAWGKCTKLSQEAYCALQDKARSSQSST